RDRAVPHRRPPHLHRLAHVRWKRAEAARRPHDAPAGRPLGAHDLSESHSMDLRPSEVTSILQRELEWYRSTVRAEGVGTVLQVCDGVSRVHGLEECMVSEILEFPNEVFGMALNLDQDNVGAILFGSDTLVKEGDQVKTTGRLMSVPVGVALIGRVVDALGRPLDGKGPIATDKFRPIEGRAPNVV